MLSCMEISSQDDTEGELHPAVAGIFPPLKKLGHPLEIRFKVLSFVGKVLCDLQCGPTTSP